MQGCNPAGCGRCGAVGSCAHTSGYSTREIRSTDSADTLTGTAADECTYGLGDDDRLESGDGSDTADYSGSGAAATVDLSSSGGQSGGHAQGDTLTNIENLIGSDYRDHTTSDASTNILKEAPVTTSCTVAAATRCTEVLESTSSCPVLTRVSGRTPRRLHHQCH